MYLGRNPQGYHEYRHEETEITFVRLPGGQFEMGGVECESEDDERPTHGVTLSPFLIAKYECTQAQWEAAGWMNFSRFQDPERPVESVPWEWSNEFCTLTGLALPTEAQWEYACRAGTRTPFSSGPDLTRVQANFDGRSAYCAAEGNEPDGLYIGETLPVGSLAPNAFGLHDMHGNVWEWCRDVYDASFYSTIEAIDPDPLCTSGSEDRVVRGGGWDYPPTTCRSANRAGIIQSEEGRGDSLGFRPVAPLPRSGGR